MTVSIDDAYVKVCLQILGGTSLQLGKAEEHCNGAGLAQEEITGARLAPDMWPYAKQVTAICHHSAGVIAAVRAGVFAPDLNEAPTDFTSLRGIVAEAIEVLRAVPPGELDLLAERDMRFEFGERRLDFTVANFLLSFSLPNFFFHATTAYDILRSKGVPLDKRDFMGQVRLKV